jgi:hypothetical protein
MFDLWILPRIATLRDGQLRRPLLLRGEVFFTRDAQPLAT